MVMNIWAILKKLKNNCQEKKSCIVPWSVNKLAAKSEHVLKVRNKFEMKTMKDYHDVYLECEVLLLANVFKKFRNNSLKNYALNSIHLSALALSWNPMLNMTKVEIELNPDPDMNILYEKGTRNGIS